MSFRVGGDVHRARCDGPGCFREVVRWRSVVREEGALPPKWIAIRYAGEGGTVVRHACEFCKETVEGGEVIAVGKKLRRGRA